MKKPFTPPTMTARPLLVRLPAVLDCRGRTPLLGATVCAAFGSMAEWPNSPLPAAASNSVCGR
jgi:hypothetical protein